MRVALLAQLDQRDVKVEMRRLGKKVASGAVDPADAAAQMLSVLREG